MARPKSNVPSYCHHGAPTGEAANCRPAIAALRGMYGPTASAHFGPRARMGLTPAMTSRRSRPRRCPECGSGRDGP